MKLETPIEYLKGVGPDKAKLLNKHLEIFTVQDLLEHYPFRYVDKTQVTKVEDIYPESPNIQVRGRLSNITTAPMNHGQRMNAILTDDTGSLSLVWFQGVMYMKKYLKEGQEYLIYGKPDFFNNRPSFKHPEMDLVEPNKALTFADRISPVYSSSDKLKNRYLDSKGLAKLVKTLLAQISENQIPEFLPKEILEDFGLVRRFQAIKNIHSPESESWLEHARNRIKFEEFFHIQMNMHRLKLNQQASPGFILEKLGDYFNDFYAKYLPFKLTNAQKRVLKEIRRDTLTGRQMNRLLQGDVGSGKTVVALITMLIALDNNFQACLMAPTEILAQQHYNGLKELLEPTGITIGFLTGSVKGKKRKAILEKTKEGEIQILIGTHALIEPTVEFQNLGMVVIDEQHRFGVAQRAKLWQKNSRPPHILVMTATPIPRTLAMTVYGDLDVSVIDELPPGRKQVRTVHRYDKDRMTVFGFIKDEIAKGRQVYVVYPLIEESEMLDYKDLTDGFEAMERAFPPPDYRISIVHGKMKPADKELEMQRFVRGETQIMVATTVIEVGVNVPNASVMIIESAERFGLSQLHQLRGRVGRGAEQSFCILMTGHKLSSTGRKRLKTMVETTDGFRIAEVDLKLRGPGDIEGTRQSGILDLKLANVTEDQTILRNARTAAAQILNEDPNLQLPKNQNLRIYLENRRNKQEVDWSRIG